ncbi:MAG: hypothetical protein IT360_06565 [Gemmatimonadaceae bacterium]|nr:hypothetical protein [Gemmatimonadaceae bacterium]
MMLSRRTLSLAIAGASLAPVVGHAQVTRQLAKPDAEFAEPFTQVSGLRELKDGRLVVIDSRDKIVQLVDFKSGAGTKIGREGSGPGEYAFPRNVFALPGDTSGVYDMLNSRTLVVLPNGKPGDFITTETSSGGGSGGMMRVGGSAPRFTDAKGRLYWSGQPFSPPSPGGGPPKTADSVPIVRYDRASKATDTMAYVRVAKNNVVTSGSSGNVSMRVGMANPFQPRDEWAVTPDGRVAVLRSPEYRVEWHGAGGKSEAAPIAYEKLKLTEQHKEQWRESRKQQTSMMITVENGQRSVRTGPPPSDMPDPGNWPEILPPFVDNATFVAPNGMIWVNRTRAANDDTPNFDVIDASGKVAMRVELPKNTRLVGLGNGTVYATRTDADDLQYLQRYRLP